GVRPPAAEAVPAVGLRAQGESVAEGCTGCEERGVQGNRDLRPGRDGLAQLLANGDVHRGVQVSKRHPFYQLAEPCLLRGAIVAPVAVTLVDHVVQLGVESTRHIYVAPERC